MSVGSRRPKNPQLSKPTFTVSLEGPSDGAFNMSEDLNLFRRAERGHAGLRVYSWEGGPWLSVGKFQAEGEVLAAYPGYRIVRRPTGGAAVRHLDEVTFALAVPFTLLPGVSGNQGRPSVRAVYRSVAESVVYAVKAVYPDASLGIEKRQAGRPAESVDCFAMVDGPDVISTSGSKLAGSALKVGREAVLLQVSIPVGNSELSHVDVFARLVDFVRSNWGVQLVSEIITAKDQLRRALAVHVEWAPFPERRWNEVEEIYLRALSQIHGELRIKDLRDALGAVSGEIVEPPASDAVDRLEAHFLPSLGASC